jgi:Rha family phage regulatory protein
MTDLSRFVNSEGMVSSKVVAEKFGKRHDHVLRDCGKLIASLPSDFIAPNFGVVEVATLKRNGKEVSEVLMSRNGFSLLAMGFTGKEALEWKVRFLEAFNQMEQTIIAEIPALKATIAQMQSERVALPEAPKKPHHLTNTTLVPVYQAGMFGDEIVEYRRVARDDTRFSELSRIEGKMAHFSNCIEGMANALKILASKAAIERRK